MNGAACSSPKPATAKPSSSVLVLTASSVAMSAALARRRSSSSGRSSGLAASAPAALPRALREARTSSQTTSATTTMSTTTTSTTVSELPPARRPGRRARLYRRLRDGLAAQSFTEPCCRADRRARPVVLSQGGLHGHGHHFIQLGLRQREVLVHGVGVGAVVHRDGKEHVPQTEVAHGRGLIGPLLSAQPRERVHVGDPELDLLGILQVRESRLHLGGAVAQHPRLVLDLGRHAEGPSAAPPRGATSTQASVSKTRVSRTTPDFTDPPRTRDPTQNRRGRRGVARMIPTALGFDAAAKRREKTCEQETRGAEKADCAALRMQPPGATVYVPEYGTAVLI